MNVYLSPPAQLSQGIHRVARALAARMPHGVARVNKLAEADHAVFHVIGWGSFDGAPGEWIKAGRPYSVIQYCLRTTENPSPAKWWNEVWSGAACVWSYYDLVKYAEGVATYDPDLGAAPFYHAPMGVEPSLWPYKAHGFSHDRPFAFLTSGFVAGTEGVHEVAAATKRLGMTQAHLGPFLDLGHHVSWFSGVSDAELARWYQGVKFVAGLRRIEGFEMPAIEGLLCGARPVVFDAPHYRDWFGDFAEYVPEADPATVTDHLVALLDGPYRPVTEQEREHAIQRFGWDSIIPGFWEHAIGEAV